MKVMVILKLSGTLKTAWYQ